MSARPAVPPSSSITKIPSLPGGWQTVAHAILADGTLAVLGADVDLASEHQRIHAALQASVALNPPSRTRELAASGTARIWTLGPAGWAHGPAFPLETPYANLDRFSDGRWLVAGARTLGEANARILNADGSVVRRIMLGDGIEHVMIDRSDRIWVAWFDEGVSGNEGWRVPDQDRAPASNGVACFADDGSLLDLPRWPDDAGSIADCYALNATGEGAWCCTYQDFPLVRCVPGKLVRWWRNSIAGVEAVAFDGRHALLAGGYGTEVNRLALVSLNGTGRGEEVREVSSWNLPLRPRKATNEWEPVCERPTVLTGRGNAIHLIDNDVWWVWRVADLAPPQERA